MTNAHPDHFQARHIGPNDSDQKAMLDYIGVDSLDQLIQETIPDNIRLSGNMDIAPAKSEFEFLQHLQTIAQKNMVFKSFIGQGYYGTITPSAVLRNVFQNPGWYTQYTPYQAEIAQGRLEALLNFQTMVSDLTGMPVANASLLDEATAAAEAMSMFYAAKNKRRKANPATKFFIERHTFGQTIKVIEGRAEPLGIDIIIGDYRDITFGDEYFGALVQYPNCQGSIEDYTAFAEQCAQDDILLCVAADIMSLALLTPPGEWGANAVVGSTQRFGVPMGFGGPHAAYFATEEKYKRQIPGRIIGISQDRREQKALRMALQTREQHIKREKATSNICTAQALLAIMASMYAVYHGPKGIRAIAQYIHNNTHELGKGLIKLGYAVVNESYFDTITVALDPAHCDQLRHSAEAKICNFFYHDTGVTISIDECTTPQDIEILISLFEALGAAKSEAKSVVGIPDALVRETSYLDHPVFNSHHSETSLMRYIKGLENKDLSLMHSMIALGSCTMKLNAATELIPVSWSEFANIHPFAPSSQTKGYQQIFEELERDLCVITGFTACSLQPNSGAQGELTGLMTIRAYHIHNDQAHRNVAIIPSSAHGTNPASAVMTGMKVVVVACDERGNIDINDLNAKIEIHKENLAALMVTYPSTHGVFESHIQTVCRAVHDAGGLVYMDGANMNAQVGFTNPNKIGADVCHLNLHKTFAIPHGGGGPGMGPICVNDKLKPFLPKHSVIETGGENGIKAVAAAPHGSASILLISYAYIQLLGSDGLTNSTAVAILNANYIKNRLADHYPVLYTGGFGRAAHELILDLRQFKALDISAEDVAKRLIDYGFHSPTLSFPVAGTIMIEPTESENKEEIDRFCDAMIGIKKEIDSVASGNLDTTDNMLKNAPHTIYELTANDWTHSYSRQQAAYPIDYLNTSKFWASVSRVDNAYGDRNLICTCPPIEAYEES